MSNNTLDSVFKPTDKWPSDDPLSVSCKSFNINTPNLRTGRPLKGDKVLSVGCSTLCPPPGLGQRRGGPIESVGEILPRVIGNTFTNAEQREPAA